MHKCLVITLAAAVAFSSAPSPAQAAPEVIEEAPMSSESSNDAPAALLPEPSSEEPSGDPTSEGDESSSSSNEQPAPAPVEGSGSPSPKPEVAADSKPATPKVNTPPKVPAASNQASTPAPKPAPKPAPTPSLKPAAESTAKPKSSKASKPSASKAPLKLESRSAKKQPKATFAKPVKQLKGTTSAGDLRGKTFSKPKQSVLRFKGSVSKDPRTGGRSFALQKLDSKTKRWSTIHKAYTNKQGGWSAAISSTKADSETFRIVAKADSVYKTYYGPATTVKRTRIKLDIFSSNIPRLY